MEQKTKDVLSGFPTFGRRENASFPTLSPQWKSLPAFSKASAELAKSLDPAWKVFTGVMAEKKAAAIAEKEREVVSQIKKSVSVDVAVCLDFTASTSHVVESFRNQSNALLERLRSGGNSANLYPYAFLWPRFEAASGAKNDGNWWKGLGNVGNGRNAPPIVAALELLRRNAPFPQKKTPGNFVVIATDEELVRDSWYEEAIAYLRQTRSTVIAILSDNSPRIVRSFSESLSSDLPESVFTVENVSKSAETAAGIIAGIRDIYVEDETRKRMAKFSDAFQVKAPDTPLLDRLADKMTSGAALLRWNGQTRLLK